MTSGRVERSHVLGWRRREGTYRIVILLWVGVTLMVIGSDHSVVGLELSTFEVSSLVNEGVQ